MKSAYDTCIFFFLFFVIFVCGQCQTFVTTQIEMLCIYTWQRIEYFYKIYIYTSRYFIKPSIFAAAEIEKWEKKRYITEETYRSEQLYSCCWKYIALFIGRSVRICECESLDHRSCPFNWWAINKSYPPYFIIKLLFHFSGSTKKKLVIWRRTAKKKAPKNNLYSI